MYILDKYGRLRPSFSAKGSDFFMSLAKPRPTGLDRWNECSAVSGRGDVSSSAFLRDARCNRNFRRPRAQSHSRRGTCDGHERLALSPNRNILPSKDALPAAAWGSNTLLPTAPSRQNKPALHSCCAGTRPPRPSLPPAFLVRLLPPALAGSHLSPALLPGIAYSSLDPPLWFGDRSAGRHYCRGKVYSPDGLRDLRAVTLPFSMTNS